MRVLRERQCLHPAPATWKASSVVSSQSLQRIHTCMDGIKRTPHEFSPSPPSPQSPAAHSPRRSASINTTETNREKKSDTYLPVPGDVGHRRRVKL